MNNNIINNLFIIQDHILWSFDELLYVTLTSLINIVKLRLCTTMPSNYFIEILMPFLRIA